MRIAVELSLYPLHKNYGPPILDYIEDLKTHTDLEITTNRMSTQLVGDFDKVMSAVNAATRKVFEQEDTVALMMKAINVVL